MEWNNKMCFHHSVAPLNSGKSTIYVANTSETIKMPFHRSVHHFSLPIRLWWQAELKEKFDLSQPNQLNLKETSRSPIFAIHHGLKQLMQLESRIQTQVSNENWHIRRRNRYDMCIFGKRIQWQPLKLA